MPDSACLHVTGITSPRSWLWRLSWPCSSYLMDYVQCFIPYDPSPHEIIPHLKLSIFLEASNVPVEETSHMFVDVLEVGRLVQRSVLQLFILWTMAGVPKIFWKWCLYFLLDNTVVKGWDGSVLTLSLSLERKYSTVCGHIARKIVQCAETGLTIGSTACVPHLYYIMLY